MKPTPQVNPDHGSSRIDQIPTHVQNHFPVTDRFFRNVPEAETASPASDAEKKLRAFRLLGGEFLDAGTRVDHAIEVVLFGGIAAISAWPILSAIVAVVRMIRNY
jgi:hypothetical protein